MKIIVMVTRPSKALLRNLSDIETAPKRLPRSIIVSVEIQDRCQLPEATFGTNFCPWIPLLLRSVLLNLH
jgi:hypothetical protein